MAGGSDCRNDDNDNDDNDDNDDGDKDNATLITNR